MSEAESTPQTDLGLTTPDPDLEKKHQEIAEEFEILGQVRDGVLWTPEMDFAKVCSCDDCRPKIETLNEFEEQINAKMSLLYQCISELNSEEDLCGHICSGALTMKEILKFLEKKLKIASEKSGVPWTVQKSTSDDDNVKQMYKEMAKRLRGVDLFGRRGDGYPNDDDSSTDEDDDDNIFEKIDAARFYYKKSEVKDDVYALLKEIKNIEKDWDNKTAETSKLEKQIKEIRKFPIQNSKDEVEKLIEDILEKRIHCLKFEKARTCIYNTSYHSIRKAKEFFKQFPLHTKVNEHSNVMKETLESLITEVNLFKKQWKDEFAWVFTPYDRSDPKRQLVE